MSPLDTIRSVDEKIRSLIMALAFFVGGMIAVFYTTGAHGAGAAQTWDGYSWHVTTAFLVMFGGAVFCAVIWSLVALDPYAYGPPFAAGRDETALEREAGFKQTRLAETEAFVAFAVAVAVLVSIGRIPDMHRATKDWLMLGSLIGFAWGPVLPTVGLWRSQGTRRILLSFALPALVATCLLAAALAGASLRWPATLYTLSWFLACRMAQFRSASTLLVVALIWAIVGGETALFVGLRF